MSEMGCWWEYVLRYAQGGSQREIAVKIGVDPTAVGRWKDPAVRPRAEHVVEFARKYSRSPVEALIHAGYIESDEVGKAIETLGSTHDLSDAALVDELAGRLAYFRRLVGYDTQDWPPPVWRREDAAVSRLQDGD
jgi:transcriptional regulator with XRE-family HTH domain